MGGMGVPRVGRRQHQCGFTLLELLVTLAIVGLLLVIVPTLTPAARQHALLRAETYQLANTLRTARAQALAGNTTMDVVLTEDHWSFPGVQETVDHFLPKDVHVTCDGFAEDAGQGSFIIRFFPDGSSSGGELRLASGRQSYLVTVHLVSGRVTINE